MQNYYNIKQGKIKLQYIATTPSCTSNNLLVLHAKDDAAGKQEKGVALCDRPKFTWADYNTEWEVSVASGIDPVLLCSLIACVDQIREDQKNQNNSGGY